MKQTGLAVRRVLSIPYTFNLLNLAAVAGLYHFCRKTAANEIWVEHRVHVLSQGAGQ